MRRILFVIILASILLAAGCQARRPANVNVPVLMGDLVPCETCEEDVVPVDGRCPICGQLLPRS